jgi:excisionase family DNA binding protein
MSSIENRPLTVNEVADYLKVSKLTILFAISSKQLPAANISAGTKRPRWRIRLSDVDAFLNSKRSERVEARSHSEKRTSTERLFC